MNPILSDRDGGERQGKLVRLRPFQPDDAERYRAWVNDPEVARLIDRDGQVTRAEHEAWYRALVGSSTAAVFAIDRLTDDAFIGLVWLSVSSSASPSDLSDSRSSGRTYWPRTLAPPRLSSAPGSLGKGCSWRTVSRTKGA